MTRKEQASTSQNSSHLRATRIRQAVPSTLGTSGTTVVTRRGNAGAMPRGATPKTVRTYSAHAVRLTKYAAGVSDPLARAEFVALAAEWRRLAALAEWQSNAAVAATRI
jgi:hypothetical protein